MTQDTKRTNRGKTLLITIGLICIVFFGCKLTKSMIKSREEVIQENSKNSVISTDREEKAANVLYSFLQRGIKDKSMLTLNQININKAFYIEDDNIKLVCAAYRLSFANGNNPTWETCLKTDDGNTISGSYDAMDYVSILTEAAFLYKMIPTTDQKIELTPLTMEEKVNEKLKKLPSDNEEEDSQDNDTNKKDITNIPIA